MNPSQYLADFDSATAMVRANARFLDDEPTPAIGMMSKFAALLTAPFARGINALPRKLREQIYSWSGWNEAIRPRRLGQVDSTEIRNWMTDQYPDRKYPAIFIGSSGGATIHLAAAMGAPWLPQTTLVPVRRHGVHPDEPHQDVQWGRDHYHRLLDENPDLQIHHMHDPNQDRLMIRHMSYFRVKMRRLGQAYESFIHNRLADGGTIFVADCQLKWPTTKLAERCYFQHGALGGATIEEFHEGSPRVEDYLERYESHRRKWDPPEPDADRPEAEWGYEPALDRDLERLARNHGYDIRRISFGQPDDLSPLVADLYRWWYRQRNMIANRLVAESFILMDPWTMLRTGSVPFWMVFNKQPSARQLSKYLDERRPFDEIGLTLFSHGTDSIGLVSIDQWRELLARARKRGFFIGADEQTYPRDFATFIRYHNEFPREIPARYPMPGPLHIDQLRDFLQEYGGFYDVQWERMPAGRNFRRRLSDRGAPGRRLSP